MDDKITAIISNKVKRNKKKLEKKQTNMKTALVTFVVVAKTAEFTKKKEGCIHLLTGEETYIHTHTHKVESSNRKKQISIHRLTDLTALTFESVR